MNETREYIYILRPTRRDMLATGATEREKQVVGEHFRYLRGLCDLGTVALAGRTMTEDERVFGVCIFRAADDTAARALMAGDPAVAQGVMTAELFPFRIAIAAETRKEQST